MCEIGWYQKPIDRTWRHLNRGLGECNILIVALSACSWRVCRTMIMKRFIPKLSVKLGIVSAVMHPFQESNSKRFHKPARRYHAWLVQLQRLLGPCNVGPAAKPPFTWHPPPPRSYRRTTAWFKSQLKVERNEVQGSSLAPLSTLEMELRSAPLPKQWGGGATAPDFVVNQLGTTFKNQLDTGWIVFKVSTTVTRNNTNSLKSSTGEGRKGVKPPLEGKPNHGLGFPLPQSKSYVTEPRSNEYVTLVYMPI